MAEKRMFSNKVIGSDMFLEMPDSTQNLYFHLSMSADDDGFVDKVKTIMRMTGKKEDDLKILIAKSFVIPFDTGIVVIKDWRINNYLRSDRYNETIYLKEKQQLTLTKNNSYELLDTAGIPLVSIDKNRIDKNRLEENRIEVCEQVAPIKEKLNTSLLEILEAANFTVEINNKINLWLEYKAEKKNTYKPTGFKAFLSQVKKAITEHGQDYVLSRFDYSMAQNYQGVFFEKNGNTAKVGTKAQFTEKDLQRYSARG